MKEIRLEDKTILARNAFRRKTSRKIAKSIQNDKNEEENRYEYSQFERTTKAMKDHAVDGIQYYGKNSTKATVDNIKKLKQGRERIPDTPRINIDVSDLKKNYQKKEYIRSMISNTVAMVKKTAKRMYEYLKLAIESVSALINAVIAGGYIGIVIICIISLIGLMCGSVFGIFFSGEDSGTGISMQQVVKEINDEYDQQITDIRKSVDYDILEISGIKSRWKEVLAIYTVNTYTDKNNPTEVATVDHRKRDLLEDMFWQMNEISHAVETSVEIRFIESLDEDGEVVVEEEEIVTTTLKIVIKHKSLEEMIALYHYNDEQKQYLNEILDDSNNQLWTAVMYGIDTKDIVKVALAEVGTNEGLKYSYWYGFNRHAAWCACFVSWCANECGYIESGTIPKFAETNTGMRWFKNHGQWKSNSYEPSPGDIIFFDWECDGTASHVGIVEKVENGYVYTVEGNVYDVCVNKKWKQNSPYILGYGVPNY